MTCEKCWRDANARMLTMGGSATDHHAQLLLERNDNPCTPAEMCGEMHLIEHGKRKSRCGAKTK